MPDINFDENFIPENSKFNTGLGKVIRLDGIRRALINANLNRDSERVHKLLLIWRNELNYKFDTKVRDEADGYEKKIMDSKICTQNLYTGETQDSMSNYITALRKYELFLGDMEKKYGLGAPDKDDPRFALS